MNINEFMIIAQELLVGCGWKERINILKSTIKQSLENSKEIKE